MRSDAGAEGTSRRSREGLGLFKSIVEFFTSVTGFAAAGVGLLGAVAAIAIADVNAGSPDGPADPSPPPPAQLGPAAPGTSPAGAPSEDAGVEREAWVRDVNQACAEVAAIGFGGLLESGDPSAAAVAFGALAETLRASPAPSGFEDAVATAADELDKAASATSLGDTAAIDHANAASAALRSVGVTGC